MLDIRFRQDTDHIRDRNGGASLGVVKWMAVSLLKQNLGEGSIKTGRLKAALEQSCICDRAMRHSDTYRQTD